MNLLIEETSGLEASIQYVAPCAFSVFLCNSRRLTLPAALCLPLLQAAIEANPNQPLKRAGGIIHKILFRGLTP